MHAEDQVIVISQITVKFLRYPYFSDADVVRLPTIPKISISSNIDSSDFGTVSISPIMGTVPISPYLSLSR